MIYLDRDLQDPAIRLGLEARLPDSIHVIHPENLSDEDIYHRLAGERGCFFVTHKLKDFWDCFDGHPKYCILCVEGMETGDVDKIVQTVDQVLRSPRIRLTRVRNGCVVRANPSRAIWYRRRNDLPYPHLNFATGVVTREPRNP